MEAERLWKELDNLLQAMEELHTGTKLARLERVVAQQWISHLKNELRGERDLKVAADGMSTRLAVELGQRQEKVWRLEAEVTRQRDEVRKLWVDVDSKSLVSLVVFLPRIHGKPFDTVST